MSVISMKKGQSEGFVADEISVGAGWKTSTTKKKRFLGVQADGSWTITNLNEYGNVRAGDRDDLFRFMQQF